MRGLTTFCAFVGLIAMIGDPPGYAASSGWVRHSPENHGAIVFVHGVLGDGRKSWTSSVSNRYWPEMLSHDPSFDGQNIYVYEYRTPYTGEALSLDQLADNLRLMLKTDGVLNESELTFVSHSMGGIVTRDFVLRYRSEIAPKIRLLIFFATPSTGSSFARAASILSSNPQFGQIVPMQQGTDRYLAELADNWFAAELNLKSYCAYETQKLFGRIIVEQDSATYLCNAPMNPIPANHFTIVKPADQDSESYRALKEAFEKTKTSPTAKASPSIHRVATISYQDAFAFQIPFLISNMTGSGIDVQSFTVPNTPKSVRALSGIAFFNSQFGVEPTREEMVTYLARVIAYYVCREVFVADDPDPPASISYDSLHGQSINIEPLISVPESQDYPRRKWNSFTESLSLHYVPHHGGPNDAWLPKNLRLPANVNIRLLGAVGSKEFTIRYEKTPNFNLDLRVAFPAVSTRSLPPNKFWPNEKRTMNDVGVTIRSDFEWREDPALGSPYRDWADHIVQRLKTRLTVAEGAR